MPDRTGDTTVMIEAAGDRRTIELPTGFVEFIREPGESAADVVADLVLLSAAQRTYEAVHFSEGEIPGELHEIDERMQARFEAEFGTTIRDVAGYPEPTDEDRH